MGLFSKYKIRIDLSKGIKYCIDKHKVKFIGNSEHLSDLADNIRKLSEFDNGDLAKLGDIDLKVSEEITDFMDNQNSIEMPNDAWNVLASKILDVVDGFEESPFYFNDCGYLNPRLKFDFGVELLE